MGFLAQTGLAILAGLVFLLGSSLLLAWLLLRKAELARTAAQARRVGLVGVFFCCLALSLAGTSAFLTRIITSGKSEVPWSGLTMGQTTAGVEGAARAKAGEEADRKNKGLSADLGRLAGLLLDQGRWEEAEDLFRQALEADQEALGQRYRSYTGLLNNLAGAVEAQGRLEEAEQLYRRALAMDRRLLGPDHPDFAVGLNNLAGVQKTAPRARERAKKRTRTPMARFGPTAPLAMGRFLLTGWTRSYSTSLRSLKM